MTQNIRKPSGDDTVLKLLIESIMKDPNKSILQKIKEIAKLKHLKDIIVHLKK